MLSGLVYIYVEVQGMGVEFGVYASRLSLNACSVRRGVVHISKYC